MNMYSPNGLKISMQIMYRKQLHAHADALSTAELERDVREYERRIEEPDQRRTLRKIVDELIFGIDTYGLTAEDHDQYLVNRVVLRKRRDNPTGA